MMDKVVLHDNDKRITSISILCMFKNNEKYLSEFFVNTMVEMGEMYDLVFNYYIIENNSNDKTREILKIFMKYQSSKSKLLLFDVENDFKNIGDGKNFERLKGLQEIRNKLVNSVTPLDSEWCLFIDSNIFFKPDILVKMFNCNPTKNNIGMLSPYTQQLFIPEIHKHLNLTKPTLFSHFYDTFSHYDVNNKTFWPFCGFEKCKFCVRKINNKDIDCDIVKKNLEIVDVNSIFGGFSLIKTEIINDERIRWGTICYDNLKNESLCEHFLFCYTLKLLTNKRIVVLQNVDEIYRTF
jgi:hypothetical protein